ncbi:phosphatidylglycerophosphatase and protein-tyrosine phosphatase 1-like [Acanthaster planci]|uniref:Phosphatidylglycerophosphatase and protein-tyrosine phosphatase 1 n=1 Tax=Acanthaster planci TaxID=133434 RepID=A0A8B8A085_ACAPL|nr:phosphatidylglycerophosphatase and protein-tyrosine phosphatase 1-like [Acanthaster planci]
MGSRVLFYPTLGYNVFMKSVSSREWYDRIDNTVLLGALPLRSKNIAQELVEKENVRGVIAMNEDFELKRFVTTKEEWTKLGVETLQLPTVDFTEAPSIDKLEQGVKFIMDFAEKQESVYVHCKAGRTRSATLVGCYLMHVNKWTPQEAQIFIQTKRHHIIMKDKHFRAMYRYYDKHIKSQRAGHKLDMSPDGE